jgi:chromosomal replication initiation ATPase DnaA
LAVGQLAKTLSPAAAVDYLTLDAFQEAFFAARAAGQSQAFRNRLGALDLLLVDDVHYLARLGETQQELLRLVQHLQSTTKQIVLAGEAAPTDIQDMDERLRVQLDGGLVVDITPPEFETRLTILQRRTAERGAELAPAVLETIAGIELESVRELLGFLNRVVALQAVSENPLTPEVVEALMAGARTAYTVGGTGVGPAREPDEFAAFMTDVAEEIEHQVEAWRARLTDGLERWKNEGYRTARLEQLLQQDVPVAVDQALKEFERDVKRLRSLETAMEAIQPGRAEDSVFRDPERVAEAEAMVEGEANREALRVAQSATGEPGRGGSLLLIVGPTGVGKTHLLHAIGNALSSASQAMVACFSAQQFQDELEEALSSEAPGQWLSRYQPVGAFLLDDVQLLIREKRAQHELAHLITRFQASGRQVVLTASAPPGEIEGLQERLAGLLERGYVVRIDTPDRDLRRAIVARKLEERHGEVSGELADYLAARSANGIRAVVTMVQRVLDTAESRGVTPSVTLARELIEGTQPVRPRPGGMRTSGVVISPLGGVRSREKMVWSWPDPGERLIEELY